MVAVCQGCLSSAPLGKCAIPSLIFGQSEIFSCSLPFSLLWKLSREFKKTPGFVGTWIIIPLLFKNKAKINLVNQISQYSKCGRVWILKKVTELDILYVWWQKWNIYDNKKQSTIANSVHINAAERFNCSMQPEVEHHLLFDQKLHIIGTTFLCFFRSCVLK